LLAQCPVHEGNRVRVNGEVRSFNNKSGQGSRLVITVYARAICLSEEEHSNRLWMGGVLCKQPVYRRTPLGREICDLMLAVNRRYGRADYLPCIAWGSLAQQCASLSVGDGVRLEGRLQSRCYTKVVDGGEEQRVAFEVSIMEMELPEEGEAP
jgi:primosomal replication protein N